MNKLAQIAPSEKSLESPIESSLKTKILNFFSNYLSMIRSPNKMIDRLNAREPNLLEALLVVLISSVIFIGGIFLYGEPTLTLYNFYSTNFLLEQWTSLSNFGYFTYTTHTAFIFLSDILFWIKIWIIFGLLIYLWNKILKIEVPLERTLEMTAWAIFPWLAATFLFIPIMLLVSLILPAYAYVIYFPVVIGVLVVISPCIFSTFLYKKVKTTSFKATFPYLFSLLTLYAIWMYSNIELWFHILIL